MPYATVYVLRFNGRILSGPNAGQELRNHEQELHDRKTTADSATQHAWAYINNGQFEGRVDILTRQYDDATRGFVYTPVAVAQTADAPEPPPLAPRPTQRYVIVSKHPKFTRLYLGRHQPVVAKASALRFNSEGAARERITFWQDMLARGENLDPDFINNLDVETVAK
jgi:hypothetical protein